jgi:UDP-hydrolysing UDP-N-acetyl-D-glucosamine 2-epimerase
VASRANYGRIKSVMTTVRKHPDLSLQIVVSASALLYRFGSVVDVMKADGFDPDATCSMVVEGNSPASMAKSTGLGILDLTSVFEMLRPDVVLTVADRYETLATAVAACYLNIPLAHTQGGELTGSIDESVRHAVTKLAHIHFTTNMESAAVLRQLGEHEETIHICGCPAIDLAAEASSVDTGDLFARYGGTGDKLDWYKPFLVVLQHPVTTEFGHGREQIVATIEAVRRIGLQTVWLWPNVDAGTDDISKALREFQTRHHDFPVHFFRNFGPEDYVRLISRSVCLVGNSSSGIREGAFLGVPAVNIGTRQSARQRGINVIDVDYDPDAIEAAIRAQIEHGKYPHNSLYGDGTAGTQIAQLLATVPLSINKGFVRVRR